MKTITINLKQPVYEEVQLSGVTVVSESGNVLTLGYNNRKKNILPDDTLILRRYVPMGYFEEEKSYSADTLAFEYRAMVIESDENSITVSLPATKRDIFLETGIKYEKVESIYDGTPVYKAKITGGEVHFYPQSSEEAPVSVSFINMNTGEKVTTSLVLPCESYAITPSLVYEGYYTTEYVAKDEFFTDIDLTEFVGEPVMVEISENPFYYKKANGTYSFWHKSGTTVTVSKETGYWKTGIPMGSTTDYYRLHMEDNINEVFSNMLADATMSMIPPINMERVKYRPMVESGTKLAPANEMVFNLHFRERKVVSSQSDPIKYDERWTINPDGGWNNISNKGLITEENAQNSDLVGYLGFSDNDVYNRKMKLRESFVRLSFYNSKDPMTQQLLFYSTAFINTGNLYGNYIKLVNNPETDPENQEYVFYKGKSKSAEPLPWSSLLNSQIVIHDEFDSENSSEGFNLYLFADDASKTDSEKDYRTIYMKVEFNHAKYGKTLPMMPWFDDCNWGKSITRLTALNYLDNLYCEVRIKYLEDMKQYVYWFPDVINDKDNMRIVLNLFEPKLEQLPDKRDT